MIRSKQRSNRVNQMKKIIIMISNRKMMKKAMIKNNLKKLKRRIYPKKSKKKVKTIKKMMKVK